jgi:hypothetical protein
MTYHRRFLAASASLLVRFHPIRYEQAAYRSLVRRKLSRSLSFLLAFFLAKLNLKSQRLAIPDVRPQSTDTMNVINIRLASILPVPGRIDYLSPHSGTRSTSVRHLDLLTPNLKLPHLLRLYQLLALRSSLLQ